MGEYRLLAWPTPTAWRASGPCSSGATWASITVCRPNTCNGNVDEYAGPHNLRELDTIDQMHAVVCGLVGKRLLYRDLVA